MDLLNTIEILVLLFGPWVADSCLDIRHTDKPIETVAANNPSHMYSIIIRVYCDGFMLAFLALAENNHSVKYKWRQ